MVKGYEDQIRQLEQMSISETSQEFLDFRASLVTVPTGVSGLSPVEAVRRAMEALDLRFLSTVPPEAARNLEDKKGTSRVSSYAISICLFASMHLHYVGELRISTDVTTEWDVRRPPQVGSE